MQGECMDEVAYSIRMARAHREKRRMGMNYLARDEAEK